MSAKCPFAVTAAISIALTLGLIGCSGDAVGEIDGEPGAQSFASIGALETINLSGTEPFWSMTIKGDDLTYSTPDNIDGVAIKVSRFNGNNGLGFSGELNDEALEIAVTPGDCSDGMSDRSYPYTVTATLGDGTLFGCGYTDQQPYTGQE